MNKIIIDSFTDESGQDTKGKFFVVFTVICLSKDTQSISQEFLEIEKDSGKNKKWHLSGDKKRHRYAKLLVEKNVFKHLKIYYSTYENKNDYISLIGSHIAKAILDYSGDQKYLAKIFMDKFDKKTIMNLKGEIKSFHIRYRKIRGLSEESSPMIRLADSVCGIYRDLGHRTVCNAYKEIISKAIKI